MKILHAVSVACLALLLGGCPLCDGPDPSTSGISYAQISAPSAGAGEVRITGTIENTGAAEWSSNPVQTSVQLHEDGAGVVAAENIPATLAVGEEFSVSFERRWDTSDEFRPSFYRIEIVYDPDIYIDGNEANDDCNTMNNEFQATTEALDALFD